MSEGFAVPFGKPEKQRQLPAAATLARQPQCGAAGDMQKVLLPGVTVF